MMAQNHANSPLLRSSRPVSCHFCRSRKLRCSRQLPCDNCSARGIICQLYGAATQTSTPSRRSGRKRTAIVSRLHKPENVVESSQFVQTAVEIAPSTTSTPVTDGNALPRRNVSVNDAEWLERENVDQSSALLFSTDKIIFRKCPIREITKTTTYIYQNPSVPSLPTELAKCIWLPLYEESKVLVEKYLRDITYIHHVIHSPSLRSLVHGLYKDLDQQIPLRPGQVALLLSVIATTTYWWSIRDDSTLFSSVAETNAQSALWVTALLDILDYSRRATSGSLEDIQAMIIGSFVLCNLEGTSLRYFDMVSTATMMARQLSLHRIDDPHCILAPPDSAQAEIGRRVWWYLVALDWILSSFAGPREGVCTINPRQMAVIKPRNIHDEDMIEGMPIVELPMSTPTSMSYFLQRMQLGELCYELNERGLIHGPVSEHARSMEIDAKFEQFLAQVPAFFDLDGRGQEMTTSATDEQRESASAILVQGHILNSMIQARRCKLHLSSLSQSTINPKHRRSRELCLTAARSIIAAERRLEKQLDLPFALIRFRIGGELYCLFIAIIALLLDVCFNNPAPGPVQGQQDPRKVELVAAFQILEEARRQTAFASKLLEALMTVVRKHQVSLPRDNVSTSSSRLEECPASSMAATSGPSTETMHDAWEGGGAEEEEEEGLTEVQKSYFDEIWQTFDGGYAKGTQFDTLDLDTLFSELESYP